MKKLAVRPSGRAVASVLFYGRSVVCLSVVAVITFTMGVFDLDLLLGSGGGSLNLNSAALSDFGRLRSRGSYLGF